MAPQFVKPYVKTNKNDVADAEAICEAVSRPNMRFVPIKSVEQQAILSVHRVRQGFVKARAAQANQIRGLLGGVRADHSAGNQPYRRTRAGAARRCEQRVTLWLTNLLNRRHLNIAAVALANKNVRTVWALLAHDREFKANYASSAIAA